MKYTCFAAVLLTTPAMAQDAEEFVRDNVLAIFYHELGHALIDVLELPIYGQEEDAADVASVMLMHYLYDNEVATQMVMSTAQAFSAEAAEEAGDVAFWGVHGASEQRYYNTICIFYGGDPDNREEMITVMGLPEERAETCGEEFDQADYSWGNVLADISTDDPSDSFVLNIRSDDAPITALAMEEEVAALNFDFVLPVSLPVIVEDCGEANAFYDPDAREITMCTEFEAYLAELFDG
ncbi:MAG: DUF4344 domain-containing metallopeptidase [Pseudomonadota bacterium]